MSKWIVQLAEQQWHQTFAKQTIAKKPKKICAHIKIWNWKSLRTISDAFCFCLYACIKWKYKIDFVSYAFDANLKDIHVISMHFCHIKSDWKMFFFSLRFQLKMKNFRYHNLLALFNKQSDMEMKQIMCTTEKQRMPLIKTKWFRFFFLLNFIKFSPYLYWFLMERPSMPINKTNAMLPIKAML